MTNLIAILSMIFIQSSQYVERPSLRNGVVTYIEDGRKREIQVGYKCVDLWVSADGNVIAFVAVEKSRGPLHSDFIEKSSIYVARRQEHFKPRRIDVGRLVISERSWNVVRSPSISPDQKILYFLVPDYATSSQLMAFDLVGHTSAPVREVTDYCVIWGGQHSGQLLLQIREPVRGHPSYPCHLKTKSGMEVEIADEDHCDANFFFTWARRRGGDCPLPGNSPLR